MVSLTMDADSDDRREQIRAHFDQFGDGEWDRMTKSARMRVAFELHLRMLRRFINPGARVLEIGAGPGRFTISLAKMGAKIVVSDVSPVQLELNETKVTQAGHAAAVESRQVLDVRDLSALPDESFDTTVAYGGPLSYAFEAAPRALAECLRVTKQGGVVLASVMTILGSMRYALPAVLEQIETFGVDVVDRIIQTGDLRPTQPAGHVCRMFRWREVKQMIDEAPCRLLAASASNASSLGHDDAVERIAANPDWWAQYLDWEEQLAREPGALDGGTHLIFAVERT
jgi:ubiquinone/menaquinone biosynthesis C-methylase UbiE